MKKTIAVILLTMLSMGGYALAQQLVDQGQPGTQGAWPVSIAGSSSSVVSTQPRTCTASSAHKTTTVGGSSINVPAANTASRIYIVVCNSPQNASTAVVKCRSDNTAVVYASGNPGDVLQFGDCVTYSASDANTIRCIADAAGREVITYECVP